MVVLEWMIGSGPDLPPAIPLAELEIGQHGAFDA